jgi:hypothetical protein
MAKGRLSLAELEFIERNSHRPANEIAKELDRDILPIRRHLMKIGKSADKKGSLQLQAEYDIKAKPVWKELKKQFTEEELELGLAFWKEIVAQFRKDVLPTEEIQIIDLIRLEILMNRALKEAHSSEIQIRSLEVDLAVEEAKTGEDKNRDLIFLIQRNIAQFKVAKNESNKEFRELFEKKDKTLKNMKATREQRIQKLESSKTTFSGMVSRLMNDPDFYDEQGREMELMRKAAQQVKEELGEFHTYVDNMIDQPLLNDSTI